MCIPVAAMPENDEELSLLDRPEVRGIIIELSATVKLNYSYIPKLPISIICNKN